VDFFDLVNISEQFMTVINPSTPEKIVRAGRVMGLKEGMRVIDFGCGFGEALALWAEQFGISGVGIDIREYVCVRARQRLAPFGDRFEIACMDASKYEVEPHSFDAAACIGATFIWGGFRETIRALRASIRPGAKMVIGEAYWARATVPPEFARMQDFLPEPRLLEIAREEGFDLQYVIRASQDDWDRYEADNWDGLLRWLDDHPGHPERQQVSDHLRA
jgi:SAM-dependent methyltransferase